MSSQTVEDAVEFAYQGDLNAFKSAVSAILSAKIEDEIALRKERIANSFMSPEDELEDFDPQEEENEQDQEF